MMRCRSARILMTKQLYEPLAAAEGAALARHLDRCEGCRAEQEEMARGLAGLRRLEAAEPPVEAPAVPVDVRTLLARRRPRAGSRGMTWTLGIAAGVAALAGILALTGRMMRPVNSSSTIVRAPSPGPSPSPGPKHRVIPGEERLRPAPEKTPRRDRLPGRQRPAPGLAPRPPRSPRETIVEAPTASTRTRLAPLLRTPRSPRERMAQAPVPDERHLDGWDARLQHLWMAGSRRNEEIRRLLERRLSRIRVQDDFVHVPLPRLASADPNDRTVREAVKQYEKDAKVVDVRLFQTVTLQLKAVSLEELCAELEKRTKVRIAASRGVRDEKVTVLVKNQRARDVMRAVARLFGYRWMRAGEEGAYRYELAQDLRSQLAEQEMRNQDLNAALLALDGQMDRYRPYLDLSPDEVQARARQAKGAEKELLNRVARAHWGAMQVYHRLTPAERTALAGGETLRFSTSSPRPDRRLPEEWRRPLLGAFGDLAMAEDPKDKRLVMGPLQFLREQGLEATPVIDMEESAVHILLKIDRSELGQLSLQSETICETRFKGSQPGVGESKTLATAQSPSVAKPDNAAAGKTLRGRAPFTTQVSLRPQPSCPRLLAEAEARKRGEKVLTPQEELLQRGQTARAYFSMEGWERRKRRGEPHVTAADMWEEVHRQTGLPVVADAYTRLYPTKSVTVEKAALFDALCRVADEMRVRWTKDGEFLLCRSSSFFWDKLKEVPNRHLARWRAHKQQQGGLPFADLLEMATLSDHQLDSMHVGDGIGHCEGLPEWDLLDTRGGQGSPRPWLRLLAGLAPEQQLRALSPEGLLVGSLGAQEQQAVVAAMASRFPPADPVEALRRAASWRIPVAYAPAGAYTWTPLLGPERSREAVDRLPVIAARTAEEALAAARKVDPSVTAEEIERTDGMLAISLLFQNGMVWTIAGERHFQFRIAP
jgi:hypothetical protein